MKQITLAGRIPRAISWKLGLGLRFPNWVCVKKQSENHAVWQVYSDDGLLRNGYTYNWKIISYYSVSVLRQLTPKIGGLNMCIRIVTICLAVQTLFTERLLRFRGYLSSFGCIHWLGFSHLALIVYAQPIRSFPVNWDFFIISSSIFFIFIILNCSLLGTLQLLLSTTLTSEAKIVISHPLPWIPGR